MPNAPTSTSDAREVSVWWYVGFTALVFGSGGLIAKGLVDDGWDPFTLSWLPFLIAGLLAYAIGITRGDLRRDALPAGMLLGVAVGAVPAILFNNGFDRLPAGIVTLVISLSPVVTAGVAHFVFRDERFNRVKAAGLVLAIVGVSILAAGSTGGDGDVAAILLVGLGAIAAGSAVVLSRIMASRYSVMSLIAPQLLTSAVVALLVAVVLGRPVAPDGGVELWHVLAIIPFGLSGYFGFLTQLKATELGTTGQVSVVGYCIPVFGVLGGALIFGDAITASVIVGGLLIMASMYIIASGSKSVAA